MNHNLNQRELLISIQIANSSRKSLQMCAQLIQAYIYDLTKERVLIGNINPIDKFEQAATIACSYFMLVNDQMSSESESFMHTEFVDAQRMSDEMKQKLRDLGVTGI